ncbi:MAG: MBL fold metallo-hydrolase [Verrucomicrobia bacterium]|nr:MBL fold metallo-hydrolase [Verrucomicrobiota bacterium]
MTRRRFLRTAALAAGAVAGGGTVVSAAKGACYRGPVSDHFDGSHFRNLYGVPAGKPFGEVARWMTTRRPTPWPASLLDAATPALPERVGRGQVAVTFVGHATFLIQHPSGLNVLTDPVWSERASPVAFAGPKRSRPAGLKLAELPRIHVVLVSHNHYDHLDLPTLRQLQKLHQPLVLTPLGNARIVARAGLRQVLELDWWEEHRPDLPGAPRITLTPAQHWSRRTVSDTNRALWGGFRVDSDGAPAWHFVGDSGYHPQLFRDIRQRLGPVGVALVPIGAYEPRWFMGSQHMDPAEAILTHRDLGARTSLGMHFGTFPLTDEAIDAPPRELAEEMRKTGLAAERFRVPGVGQTVTLA